MLCCALSAQRYIVDAAGGGNFLDLPQAVAAVPDGATLVVRPGAYSEFSLQGKGLTIAAHGPGCTIGAPLLGNDIVISNVPLGKRVLLSGFTTSSSRLRITSCAGTVVVHELVTNRAEVGWVIQGCQDVHLLDVVTSQGRAAISNPYPALTMLNSNVEIARGRLFGASTPLSLSFGKADGQNAAYASASTVTLTNTTLTGGTGSNELPAQVTVGIGGSGLIAENGSRVQIYGNSVVSGGSGGAYYHTLTWATSGDGVRCDATSSVLARGASLVGGGAWHVGPGSPFVGPVTWVASAPSPREALTGAVTPNSTVHLLLSFVANAPAALLIGDPAFQPVPFLEIGALLVTPLVVLAPLTTDGVGFLDVPLVVPASWPGAEVSLHAQFVTLDPIASTLSTSGTLLLYGRY